MTLKEKGPCERAPIPNAIVCQDKPESKSNLANKQEFLGVYALNRRESLRSELLERHGKRILRIGRWRTDCSGAPHPAGIGIECSADHLDGFAEMIAATKLHLVQGGA